MTTTKLYAFAEAFRALSADDRDTLTSAMRGELTLIGLLPTDIVPNLLDTVTAKLMQTSPSTTADKMTTYRELYGISPTTIRTALHIERMLHHTGYRDIEVSASEIELDTISLIGKLREFKLRVVIAALGATSG